VEKNIYWCLAVSRRRFRERRLQVALQWQQKMMKKLEGAQNQSQELRKWKKIMGGMKAERMNESKKLKG
jgi:hypothetical protein